MTHILTIFISILGLTVSESLNTFLNVDELNSIHYAVDILDKPVKKDQSFEEEVVTMVNKHGQEYICTLPEVFTSQTPKKDENILDQLTDISELLKPMEAAPCLVKTKDWWTYEFCYGSVIKQYHLEDNKVTGPILILGKYESEYSWKNSSETKNRLQRFHSQFYVNGTKCDITGEPRKAEVRFHCEASIGDLIQRVDEPESCRYVVTVATTRVCHHPYLRPQSSSTPHTVSCYPALTIDQFNRYTKQQQLKLQKAEKDIKIATEIADEDNPAEEKKVESEEAIDDSKWNIKWKIKSFDVPSSEDFTKKDTDEQDGNRHTEKTSSSHVTVDDLDKMNIDDLDIMIEDITNAVFEKVDTSDDSSSPSSTSSEDAENNVDNDNDKTLPSDVPDDKLEEKVKKTDYLTEDDILEDSASDIVAKTDEDSDDDDDLDDDPPRKESVNRQLAALKLRLEKIMDNWVGMQNSNDVEEFLEKIFVDLEESLKILQERATKIGHDSLSQLVKEVIKMTDRLKDQDNHNEDLDTVINEEKLNAILATLAETLDETESEVRKAKQKMIDFEKYLDKQFVEDIQGTTNTAEDPKSSSTGSRSQKPSLDPSSPNPISDAPKDSTTKDSKASSKTGTNTRHLRILNEKTLDEPQKTKIEKFIRERLQSGLDNYGRKIEVKILTPNYLDDDERDPLATLTKEETEAFQNMIITMLRRNEEELDEREKHQNLVKNYNFKFDDLDADDPVVEDKKEGEGD